jgi:hypothetical protein
MSWNVEYTNEFEAWWDGLGLREQNEIQAAVELLELRGPTLRYPLSSGIRGSRHGHMRELRVQCGGDPYRVLYAFDPRRSVILLIGGNKTGNDRWYEQFVPIADRLYDEHVAELRNEGRI